MSYPEKLARIESQTLLPTLRHETRQFLRRQAEALHLTMQELREIALAARDLEMWGEPPLEQWWCAVEPGIPGDRGSRKKGLLRALRAHVQALAGQEKLYPEAGLVAPPRRRVQLQQRETEDRIFGRCPAYSERTVCCGLLTLDAVRGCAFSCSYCTIQTFYGERAEVVTDLPAKLAALELDPDRRYHIGTGQASDSLVWANREGTLSALVDFAASHPNVLLELKTKSANIGYLLEIDLPGNLVVSFSLNAPTIIANEEWGTASLERRLAAARALADRGVAIAFHFHPMIWFHGWQDEYGGIARSLLGSFAPREVQFISMGSVTLIKPVLREIRQRGGNSKILQMEMTTDPHGKLTYPDEIKRRLFRHLFSGLADWRTEVFFYLCMETEGMWQDVLGWSFSTNEAFETAFLDHCLGTSRQGVAAEAVR